MLPDCILCGTGIPVGEEKEVKTIQAWETLEKKAREWAGLDTFGSTNITVKWSSGPDGQLMHKGCKLKISSSRCLSQAKTRKEKQEIVAENAGTLPEDDPQEDAGNIILTRRTIAGPIHSKFLCVWCGDPEDDRHPNLSKAKLLLITQVFPFY